MDEYNTGMDPEMKRYFKKIISSFSWGAIWLISISTLGIFMQLAFVSNGIKWYNLVFYFVLIASLYVLVRYYYRQWK